MSLLHFILKKDKASARFFCKVAPLVLEVVMSEKQILINCGKKWFEFSKSRTGQLDYCGKVENPGLEKAGYVRAAAAKIIRAAKPERMSFKAQLMRIDCRNVVLKIEL